MTYTEIQLAGKLSSYEILIEVMLTKEMATLSEKEAKAFCADIMGREANILRAPNDARLLAAIQQSTRESLDNLLSKALSRSSGLRRDLARDH
jgi:hypothetical protein